MSGCGYLARLQLVRALVHLIDLLRKLGEVRDDELLLKSLSKQHDVVNHTPTRQVILHDKQSNWCLIINKAI